MFECAAGAVVKRLFAICAKASFNPKYQLWAVCEYSACNVVPATCAELVFPFDVELVACPCSLTGAGQRLDVRTSHQLAEMLIKFGMVWSAVELKYIIPPGDSLKFSRVASTLGDQFMISGPDVPKSAKRVAEPKDDIMEALRKRPRLDALVAGHRAARSLSSSQQPQLHRRHGDAGIDPIMPIEDGMAGGIVDFECFDEQDQFPADLDVLAELLDFHIDVDEEVDVAAPSVPSSSAASSSSAPPLVAPDVPFDEELPAPPPVGDDIEGPSASGYFTRGGRAIGRLTAVFGGSRGVRCYQHANCSVPFTIARCPEVATIKAWLVSADPCLPADLKPIKDGKRAAHMTALRLLGKPRL